MTWQLPDSPDSKLYTEIIDDISLTLDPRLHAAKFRALAEADLYAFLKWASTFGKFQIRDPGHRRLGGFWVDEPYCFDFARRVQQDVESRRETSAYFEPRFHFKTTIPTINLSIWETLKDSSLTTAFLMYKVDQMGEAVFRGGLLAELEENEILLRHWPDILSRDKRDYPLWTNTAATIKREPGPKEPSFSIHSLSQQPTSGHYRRIRVDDAVIGQTVSSLRQIRETKADIKKATALASDDTLWTHVGTVWDANDPNMQLAKEGYFGESFQPGSCFHPDGEPKLRSKTFLNNWIRKLGPYEASCQLLGKPIAKGDQGFKLEWIAGDGQTGGLRYPGRPRDQRYGKVVNIFCDISFGTAEDFSALSVIGLGLDRNRYHLDLIREKGDPNSVIIPLLFAAVRAWRPQTVWTEDLAFKGAVEAEMVRESFRFRIRMVPDAARKTQKERRISALVAPLIRGEHIFPRDGFGHGSHGDRRDTMEQLIDDEYLYWSPEKGLALNDDMLDAIAWVEQEAVRRVLVYPETASEEMTPEDLMRSAFEEAHRKQQQRSTAGPSWQAW